MEVLKKQLCFDKVPIPWNANEMSTSKLQTERIVSCLCTERNHEILINLKVHTLRRTPTGEYVSPEQFDV